MSNRVDLTTMSLRMSRRATDRTGGELTAIGVTINLSYSKILQLSNSLGLRPSELLALAESRD